MFDLHHLIASRRLISNGGSYWPDNLSFRKPHFSLSSSPSFSGETRSIYCLLRFVGQGDGMLGLYTSVALRELGFETVYCSGTRIQRSKFIERFGAIPLYNGKSLWTDWSCGKSPFAWTLIDFDIVSLLFPFRLERRGKQRLDTSNPIDSASSLALNWSNRLIADAIDGLLFFLTSTLDWRTLQNTFLSCWNSCRWLCRTNTVYTCGRNSIALFILDEVLSEETNKIDVVVEVSRSLVFFCE